MKNDLSTRIPPFTSEVMKCATKKCPRIAKRGRLLCSLCMLDQRDADREFRRWQHDHLSTTDVAIEYDQDWRPHVMASSRLPKRTQVDPEGPAAIRCLRDGRRLKRPDLRTLVVLDPFEEKGDDDWKLFTLEEIATEMNLYREQVRNIESQALGKLRKSPMMRELIQLTSSRS